MFLNCQKETISTEQTFFPNESKTLPKYPADLLSLETAQSFFLRKQSEARLRNGPTFEDSVRNHLENLTLLWEFADSITYKGSTPLLAVPVAIDEEITFNREMFMLFFINNLNEIDSRLVLIYGDDTFTTWNEFTEDFTGFFIQMDWDGRIVHSYKITTGNITEKIYQIGNVTLRTQEVSPPCNGGSYYEFGPMGFYIVPCGGGGGGGGDIPLDDPFGLGGGSEPGGSGGGGSTPNTGPELTNFFNLEDYEGEDRKAAHLINHFKEKYGIIMGGQEILDAIIEECQPEGGLFWWLKQNLPQDGSFNNILDCIENVIIADRLNYIQQETGIALSDSALFQLFEENCIFTDLFFSCFSFEEVLEYYITVIMANNPNWDTDDVVLSEISYDTTVNSLNPICSNMFEFRYTDNSHEYEAAGILNLNIEFYVNNDLYAFKFPAIYFQSRKLEDCPQSLEQIAAYAINQTLVSAPLRIS